LKRTGEFSEKEDQRGVETIRRSVEMIGISGLNNKSTLRSCDHIEGKAGMRSRPRFPKKKRDFSFFGGGGKRSEGDGGFYDAKSNGISQNASLEQKRKRLRPFCLPVKFLPGGLRSSIRSQKSPTGSRDQTPGMSYSGSGRREHNNRRGAHTSALWSTDYLCLV
jgi:hypothetical protein